MAQTEVLAQQRKRHKVPFMILRTSSRRRRSHSRHGARKGGISRRTWAARSPPSCSRCILAAGPLVLGSDRSWIDLPLCSKRGVLALVPGPPPCARIRPCAADARSTPSTGRCCSSSSTPLCAGSRRPQRIFLPRIEMLDVVGYVNIFLTCRYGMANRRFAVFLLYLLVVLGVGELVFGYYFEPAPRLAPIRSDRNAATALRPALARYLRLSESLRQPAGHVHWSGAGAGSYSRLAWPVRIFCSSISGLMMMVGVVYSASRGSWLALVVAIIALLIWGLRHGALRW